MNLKFINIVLFCLLSSIIHTQEVKLGLPIGHINKLYSARLSPNGKYVLTTSRDHKAMLFDVSSGKLILTYLGHTEWVKSAVFSPDGQHVLTASNDSTAKLFDTYSGKEIHTLMGHKDSVTSAIFSPDGQLVVTTSNDETTKLFDAIRGNEIHTFEGHSAAFSPDGTKVVTATNDHTANLYDVTSGKLITTYEGHLAFINSVAFSPDGQKVLTASNDQTAKLFDVASGRLISTFLGHTNFVNSATFSPDGRKVITASDDHTAKLYDVSSGSLVHTLNGHTDVVSSAIFSPDGQTVLTASNDHTSKLFEVSSGKLVHNLKGHSNLISSASFSRDGSRVVTSSFDHSANIYDTLTGEVLVTCKGHTYEVRTVTFSPDGRHLLLASYDNTVKVLDFTSGKLIHIFNDHRSWVSEATYSPNGDLIATASKDSTARVFNSSSGTQIQVLNGHSNWVGSARFNPKGKQVITSARDNTAKLFDVSSGNLIRTFYGHTDWVKTANFSSDGQKVLTASWDSTAKLFDVSNGVVLHTFKEHSDRVWSATFSPDGKYILTASEDGTAKLFDTQSLKLIQSFDGNDWVLSAGFSPDGTQIVTTSRDNIAKLFDISSGKVLDSLKGHTGWVKSASFSPDGKYIATSSNDGSIILHDFETRRALVRSFIFDGDPLKWVHLHPSGLFDASPEAMSMMYWTKGMEYIEFEQLKDRYWLPGLWEEVMTGKKLPSVRGMNQLKLEPEVAIKSISTDSITIQLTKREGGYGKVALYINGKEAVSDIRPGNMDYSLDQQSIRVCIKDHPYLLDGENEITIKASSEDGFVQGRGAIGKAIVEKRTSNPPQFFGVVIGIGDYLNDNINLKYTVSDAVAISKAMQLGAENLFGQDRVHMYSITSNSDITPSKENIQKVFKEISNKAKSEDIITVYLSGHGITWGGEQGDFYFLTSDAMATNTSAYNDPAIRQSNAISTLEWVEWLKGIPALKQVMIIDACGSGKAVDNLIAVRNIEPSQIKAIDRMKDRIGMYIISGCTADAVSFEASMYGQGLLTYSILEAMKGAALKEDKYVDVFTIMDYARENVPKLAEGIGGIQEPQLLIPKGGSFDLGILNSADREEIPLANPKTVYVRSSLVDARTYVDHLGLSELLNDALSLISSNTKSSPLVFLDSDKFPNACKINGGYTVKKRGISIELTVVCGDNLDTHRIKASTADDLINKITGIIKH